MAERQRRCPGCYDSFSGPWCDNCDQWPCVCLEDEPEPPDGMDQAKAREFARWRDTDVEVI